MAFPCKFYNSEKGCRSTEETCGHQHVLYCTNEICVGVKKNHTHTFANCGQKGGGAHQAFIAMKREKAMAEKAKKKAETSNEIQMAKNAIGEKLYTQVLNIFTDNDNAGYNQVMKDFPVDLPADRLAGKTVGMILDGLGMTELIELVTNSRQLVEHMTDAIEVLHKHNA